MHSLGGELILTGMAGFDCGRRPSDFGRKEWVLLRSSNRPPDCIDVFYNS